MRYVRCVYFYDRTKEKGNICMLVPLCSRLAFTRPAALLVPVAAMICVSIFFLCAARVDDNCVSLVLQLSIHLSDNVGDHLTKNRLHTGCGYYRRGFRLFPTQMGPDKCTPLLCL